jgi:amino acid transporter/mannitol/fructose-specific phosphotransferase system IIA component (Ntr-type)
MDLKKELNLLNVFCIASGAMISSGIFILPGLAHAMAGPAVFVSYLLAGLLASIGVLNKAELVSALPKAGGTYFHVSRSMGPILGTVEGMITWFSLSLKSAFALIGMAAFSLLLINVNIHIIAISLCIIFILINFIGVKEAGWTQVILVVGLLGLMLLYIILGLPAINIHNFEPFAPNGIGSIFTTAGFVFISYGGVLKVAAVAEEVKEPKRTIPLGMIFSLLVVTIFYMLVVLVTSGVLGASELDNSLTPITDGATVFMGMWGKILLSIAAILAFVSTANAGIMSASRYPLALSRDGLLPEFLSNINKRFRTPHISILITGLFMIIALFLKLDILVKAASSVLILTYLFSCLSIIILRESRLLNYQPSFRAPLYPWIQIVGIISYGFLLYEIGKHAIPIISILIATGLFIYWFYGRIRTSREYALLYLIERITAKELTTHSLEDELKEIIRERDEIIKDRFDDVIENCSVLDIERKINIEELFRLISDLMADKLNVSSDILYRLLIEREKESTTAITPSVAIPHIIIEGKNKFDILIVRCHHGVYFSENAPSVKTIFVLIGSKDERNFHLRSLAAIAQIVQDINFEKSWMCAKNKEALRDIVLLGKRRR